MQSPKLLCAVLFSATALLSAMPASAVYVDPEPQTDTHTAPVLLSEDGYERVEFVDGSYLRVDPFTVEYGGSYELTLTDLLFPHALRKLGAAVTTAEDNLADLFGTGNVLFDLEPGTYYLSVYAKAFAADKLGLFGVSLNPYVDVSAVPVPAAVWLFGSGLIGLAGFGRRLTGERGAQRG